MDEVFDRNPADGATAEWDYLILTAANEPQAAVYRRQLEWREELELSVQARQVLVVPDLGGRRMGSGGSTLHCLAEVLNRQRHAADREAGSSPAPNRSWHDVLRRLRVLIMHAGGDSRRLPAYGACGKPFMPVPAETDSCLPVMLFDRQIRTLLALPATPPGAGQVVIAAGDVLLQFDTAEVAFAGPGITALGCPASLEQGRAHGVFCCDAGNRLRRFLQKPSVELQRAAGAIDEYGRCILDIGVTNLDANTACRLLELFGLQEAEDGRAVFRGPLGEAVGRWELDFYREICCALGEAATLEDYIAAVRAAGSRWEDDLLQRVFDGLRGTPVQVEVLPRCGFLHFGTGCDVIRSGQALRRHDAGTAMIGPVIEVANEIGPGGRITAGGECWVEGCRIRAPLDLAGDNLVVGADVGEPLSLPRGLCLDVLPGRDDEGRPVSFVRCYGIQDGFKDAVGEGALFCGRPLAQWLECVGAEPDDVWDPGLPADRRTLWNARLFAAEESPGGFRRWLWMADPETAPPEDKAAWRRGRRWSLERMAALADADAFLGRRLSIQAARARGSLRRLFRSDSRMSAGDLAAMLRQAEDPAGWVADVLTEARWYHERSGRAARGLEPLAFPRIVHSLATAVMRRSGDPDRLLARAVPGIERLPDAGLRRWLASLGLDPPPDARVGDWCRRLRSAAFEHLGQVILASAGPVPPPRQALRSDELVWGRAPARIDFAGGWSDTPPYALEYGGCVANAAIDLNGQPPIQAYARVTERPVIRISSIDLGRTEEITDLESLLDYRRPGNAFALARAALALSGFSPQAAAWPPGTSLRQMLERFGGGIELTTLAAIPAGSGLGTSSIMGAVILAVVQRVMGRTLRGPELFHAVLRLEQAMSTGGGWQDQIGGSVGGLKLIRTRPGLVPDATIHALPADVLDPRANGGATLLYYTGLTRLARNILEQVVGRYLDRDRASMAVLDRIRGLAPRVADAVSRKDLPAFGRLVSAAWELNRRLDPNSTNEEVESILNRAGPFLYGAKLAGAGGGGFLFMVCRSPEDAARLRDLLESAPPNPRARFFDFNVNPEGLVVTVC